MLRCLTLALLVALLAAFTAGLAMSAGNAALETAVGPEALLRLEQEGKVTVRALGAWGRLPDRYVALGRSLRADTGLNLLDADAAAVAGWLAKAEGGDARFGPAGEGLKDLLGYLEQGDFLDWEAVADEGAVAPGALLRQSGRRWVNGADDGASGLATSSAPAAQTAAQTAGQDAARTLFDGDMADAWLPYQADGGRFKDFAKVEGGMFVVDVPEGNGWGRTGMHSNASVVASPRLTGAGERLSVQLDPHGTSDAVISLVPADAKADDEWRYHHVRVGVHLESEDGPRTLTLWIAQQAVMTREIAEVPERIDLVLRPDDAVIVTDGSGKVLLQGMLDLDAPKEGYRLYALAGSTSKRRGKPLRLALRSIGLSPEAFAAGPAHDSLPDGEQRVVLFENGVLGRWWIQLAGQGGDFRAHTRLEDGELAVDVPAGARWGKVGIYSPGPLLWLDRFGPGAEAGVTFEFDPARTTGFVVALSPLYNLKDNDPNKPHVWVQWNAKEDGSGGRVQVMITPDFPKAAWEWETPATAPDKVTLRLSPDGVLVQGFGAPEERMPWKCVMPNMGFRVYAFSQAEKAGLPVRMALKRVTLDRTAGGPLPPEEPAAGVEPLGVDTLFGGVEDGAWENYGIRGADFVKHARFEGGRLVAEVPADAYSWPKVGIVSREPAFAFNERIQTTPYAVRIVCDRSHTSGVEAVFRSGKSAEIDRGAEIQASFVRHDTGPDAGMYVLSLSGENAIYRNWSRRVDAGWVDAHWDGTLEVRFGDGWAEALLPGGPAVRGMDLRTGKGWSYHMAVTSCPEAKSGAAALALEKVVGGWVTPSGMTAAERWNYVDDESFDADAFVTDLAGGLDAD